ncbi:DUF4269 domain-containing protein [Niabella sp. W65]|nr:DUF4269 domain-containing protein [Niabella sp. W65]MCH7369152.1 DUF4269 domain-containing protein [Niabella sp. W65]
MPFQEQGTVHGRDQRPVHAAKKFSIRERTGKEETVVVNFFADGFEIEIFAQNIPTRQQMAYRHLVIEHELLNQYGEVFRQQVVALKKQGYKTEPAFARLLKLEGDPYQALLRFEAGISEQPI